MHEMPRQWRDHLAQPRRLRHAADVTIAYEVK
jgi:hypothetical protein